jgi:hypothetical protein
MPANRESPFRRFPGSRGPVGAGLAGEQEITLLAISWFQSVYLSFMTPVRRAERYRSCGADQAKPSQIALPIR